MTYYKWIDVAKGIGILWVVVFHATLQMNLENAPFILSTVAALPFYFINELFFFLSGFLLNSSSSPLEFTRKKIKRLVIPYFFAYILISIFLFISYTLIKVPDSFSGFHYFLGMLYGTLLEIYHQTGMSILTPLWFLPALFCALLIGYFLIGVFQKDQMLGALSLIVTVSIGYALSLKHIHLPWGFDIAMVAQLFVIPGYYLKKSGYAEIKEVRVWSVLLLVLGFIIASYFNVRPTTSVGQYNNLVLYFVAAACAIIGICILSYYLVSFSPIERILSFFGKNALIIMCFSALSIVAINYIAVVFPPVQVLYYSNVIFETACMLFVSIIFIVIINKIPFLKRIFSSF
jgi:acyltransferase